MPKDNSGNIFRGKDPSTRKQGLMTPRGDVEFEQARLTLGKLYERLVGRAPVRVSDGDVFEALSRGWADTERYIRRKHVEWQR